MCIGISRFFLIFAMNKNKLFFYLKIRVMLNNFEFRNPTKLIMGDGVIAKLSEEIPNSTKVMLTFGG